MNDVTRILSRIEDGDGKAAEQLLPLVYEELRKLAAQKMAQEKPGQTLLATALVHEAYLRLFGKDGAFNDRRHFIGAGAEAMRRILVDQARRKQTVRHGGEWKRHAEPGDMPLEHRDPAETLIIDELWRIDLGDAIKKLGKKAVVQGNLDPCPLFLPQEKIEERVKEILWKGEAARGHIFNLGQAYSLRHPLRT